MAAHLLTTKLYIPPASPNLVPRPNLVQRLDEGLQLGHKLTRISAPAGFGKTTLLSEWIGGYGRPVAPDPPRPACPGPNPVGFRGWAAPSGPLRGKPMPGRARERSRRVG
jgi:hypothetical protein